jgi:single-stranded-DNA-specific exonuclease
MKTKLVNENFKSDWVKNLLIARGVDSGRLEEYLHPTWENIADPSKLDNCEAAANRIIKAAKENEHIGLVIDSDVDGITSSTIIYRYLHEINPDLEITYFFHDGKQHGLEDSWEKFIDAKVSMVIEPDAGINDKEFHDKLGEANIDTVVLDHHEYENGGFSTHAIYVDNQTSPNYENKSLAGCGVTWQACRMMDEILGTSYSEKYIDLVALGCAADVMSPLSYENRMIFEEGFSHITNPTFKAFCDKQAYSMQNIVNYTSVAFYVAPLINACMRTGEPEEKLLMYKMFLHPERIVESHKRGAKGEQVSILEEGLRVLTNVKARQQRLIDKYLINFRGKILENGLTDNNIIVIPLTDEDDFTSELNGLLAMKLSGEFHKPCLFLRAGDDGLSKGSARNPNGSPISDLKEFYKECPYVEWVFGHASAHGVAVQTKHLDDFVDWFNKKSSCYTFNENSYEINFDLRPTDEYFEELCTEIGRWDNLWGGNNPVPVISMKQVHLNKKDITIQGKSQDSIKFTLNGVACVMFKCKNIIDQIQEDGEVCLNFVGRANLNTWMGRTSAQLIIDDIEVIKDNVMEF